MKEQVVMVQLSARGHYGRREGWKREKRRMEMDRREGERKRRKRELDQ